MSQIFDKLSLFLENLGCFMKRLEFYEIAEFIKNLQCIDRIIIDEKK